MDIGQYRRYCRVQSAYMGADDDFIGPPKPDSKFNVSDVFTGLNSLVKSVGDTIAAGNVSVNKSGIQFSSGTQLPGIYTTGQQTVVQQPDYTKYALIGIPLAGLALLLLVKK